VKEALSKVEQIKAKNLQNQLDALISDYEALSQQLTRTSNAGDRNKLERELQAIAQEMEQKETALNELAQVAASRIEQEEAKPQKVAEESEINPAQAPLSEPKLRYRKEVERIVREDEAEINFMTGELNDLDRLFLDNLRRSLNLEEEEAKELEKEVMEPYRQREEKKQQYEAALLLATQEGLAPLTERDKRRLKRFQDLLGLTERRYNAY
jgi:hypothetical protein